MSTDLPTTISIPEAARILGISPRSAYRAAATGDIPSIRIRGRVVVPTHRLFEILNGQPRRTSHAAGDPPSLRTTMAVKASK